MLTVRMARMPAEPVVNAAVSVVDGGMYWTDEHGQVTLPAQYNGRIIEIMEHGYLSPRRVIYKPGMLDHLLPDDQQMPADWLHAAFYKEDDSSLNRPREGLIAVELGPELLKSRLFTQAAAKAIEYLNRAQPNVDFFIAQTGVVKMELAPNDPLFSQPRFSDAWAIITGEFSNGYIVRSRVVWKFITRPRHQQVDEKTLWQAVAHELGHHTGIWGHPPGGIMNKSQIADLQDFTPREKEALKYLFLRSVGTKKPDDSTWRPSTSRTLKTQQTDFVATRTVSCGMVH